MRFSGIETAPPGPFYDDAANGLIAQSIAYGGARPVFTLAFTGREPLYHYVVAVLMRLIGHDLLALRLASFYLGMIAVAAITAFGHAFFKGRKNAHWLALLTGTLAATTFWPVSNARFGLRAISFTFTISLLLWSLTRLVQRGKLSDAIWTGIWTGATAYTYTANRIVPIALGLALGWLSVGQKKRLNWQHVGILVLVAGVLFLPMGIFLTKHPEIITHRASQVAIVQSGSITWNSAVAILRGVLLALGAFGFKGDPLLYLNVPGRPVFGVLIAAFFYLGLATAIIRVIRSQPEAKLDGMLVLWFGVMLLPGALTIEPFHSLRSIGTLPVAMLLPIVGIDAILSLIAQRWEYVPRLRAQTIIWIALLTGTTLETYDAYFNKWAGNPDLYSLREGDIADLGRWFNTHDTGEAPIYIVSFHYQHPTMAFIAEDYDRMKWAALAQTIVYPPPGKEAYIGIPQSTLGIGDRAWLEAQLASFKQLAAPIRPDGRPAYLVYYVSPSSTRPQPAIRQEIVFAGAVRLLGYDPPRSQNNLIKLTLYWEIINHPPVQDYGLVARLVDTWGFKWSEQGIFNYPPEQWQPGETIVHQVIFERPVGLPPGNYTVELEWFSPGTNGRLPVVREGQFGGVYGYAGPIMVEAYTGEADQDRPIQYPVHRAIGPLTLIGYERESIERYAGDILRLALRWQAETQPGKDLIIRLELEDAEGRRFELSADHPVHGSYPTSHWTTGEIVTDRYAIRLDPSLPAGRYTLWVEVETADEAISLGELVVYQSERLFEPPPLQHTQTATFGNVVRLLGYDLDGPFRADESIPLRLVWQAISPPPDSYSVFVHLVDAEGTIVAQHDGVPRGDYALFRWVPGEVVIDEVVLTPAAVLPEGDYRLRIGFYKPETGERLPVLESSGEAGVDFVWLDQAVRVRLR